MTILFVKLLKSFIGVYFASNINHASFNKSPLGSLHTVSVFTSVWQKHGNNDCNSAIRLFVKTLLVFMAFSDSPITLRDGISLKIIFHFWLFHLKTQRPFAAGVYSSPFMVFVNETGLEPVRGFPSCV